MKHRKPCGSNKIIKEDIAERLFLTQKLVGSQLEVILQDICNDLAVS